MGKIIGIIGGSGYEDLGSVKNSSVKKISTARGPVKVEIGSAGKVKIVFLPRHDFGHKVPPHMIDYVRNMLALRKAGVSCIIATAAVGSLRKGLRPGDFIVPSDFIDFTKSREPSLFSKGVVHTDMAGAYDKGLISKLDSSVKKIAGYIPRKAVYAAVEGPRFETKAEIRAFKLLGADVVGMTQVPEVVLAKEAGIPYCALGVVTNYACGITDEPVSMDHIESEMKKRKNIITEIIRDFIGRI